ncbi:hypothetical protein FRX31_023704 [Thalictrum thalictroides]|uniref:Uncharacterized protein n=1 Tax=Thalictrum thalictroides TaxID=46969 RepID=A0A7J6VP91_THATH|nr:hypothetical protein FRX31_023704 [Thalictrum thalictroides]
MQSPTPQIILLTKVGYSPHQQNVLSWGRPFGTSHLICSPFFGQQPWNQILQQSSIFIIQSQHLAHPVTD